jgi:hypothetical protein
VTRVYQKPNHLSAKAYVPFVLHCALVSPNYAEATSCNMQCHYTQMTRNHAIATMSIEIPAQFASQVPQVWKWKLVSENC